jgi:hypothetical protein
MSRHLQIARAYRPPRALLGSLAPGEAAPGRGANDADRRPAPMMARFASARESLRQRGETPR